MAEATGLISMGVIRAGWVRTPQVSAVSVGTLF